MSQPDADEADAPPPVPRWVAAIAVAGIVGLVAYVGGWLLAGAIRSDYDPMSQAISQLFELGAPSMSRWLMMAGLATSGLALVAFAVALERGLPGRGRAGPVVVGVSGVMTLAVIAAPCSPGCPGMGTTGTDTAHVLIAGTGYLALMLAPLLVAHRVRPRAPRLARWSVVIAVLALATFAVRSLGVADELAGLQQRVYNTVADLWYLMAAVWLIRERRRRAGRSHPDRSGFLDSGVGDRGP